MKIQSYCNEFTNVRRCPDSEGLWTAKGRHSQKQQSMLVTHGLILIVIKCPEMSITAKREN